MRYKNFGTTGLTVSEVGFGCARLGGIFGNLTRSDMLRTLDLAFEKGITFYDTSDMYCQGESEKLLGEAFQRKRDKVIIASKVGYCLPARRKLAARVKPLLKPIVRRLGIKRQNLPAGLRGSISQDFSPDYILKAVEESLKRLRTDYLDLYQLHSPPTAVLESGEFLDALEKLQRQGKIRHFGISCERAEDALICLKFPGLASLQLRLNLLDQHALDEALPQAAGRGIGVITRECFAGGLLTKPLSDLNLEEFIPDPAERELRQKQVTDYRNLAENFQRPLAQVALQFVRSLEGVSVTLLGMNTESHLLANLAQLDAPSLSEPERQAIRQQSRINPVSPAV